MSRYGSIIILGSTGSIGVQALKVAKQLDIDVVALAAGTNINVMEAQIREFNPSVAVMHNEKAAAELRMRVADTGTKILSGEDGVCVAAALSADTVLNAIVGIAGLKPTIAAITSGNTKRVALANKETLVVAGSIVMRLARDNGIDILPVDSEHSAIFQCLLGAPLNEKPEKIILTASGGPFFGRTISELRDITPEDALRHPNWDMGAKITIDSATLMNKGLEIIEAVHLFDISPDKIEVVVHRESIIHSAVEYSDGSVIAQLGMPDMCIPIQLAITHPSREVCPAPRLSLTEIANLSFYKPDFETFSCLGTCIAAIKSGGLKPAAANGANEQAVSMFLNGKIGFLDIGRLIKSATEKQPEVTEYGLSDVFAADMAAREFVKGMV